MLEALPGMMFLALFRVDLSMSDQYRMNRTGRFDLNAFIAQDASYLCRTPRRLLGPYSQNMILKLRTASAREVPGTAGPIKQTHLSGLSIPQYPLIGRCRTDSISTAQLPDVGTFLARQFHELCSRFHDGHLPEGHLDSPRGTLP